MYVHEDHINFPFHNENKLTSRANNDTEYLVRPHVL